jgi:hypothetical protein
MILYTDFHTKQRLYDTNMIQETFDLQMSFLKREINRYGFTPDDYIRYKNIHLFKESSVLDFIEYLVEKKLGKDVSTLKRRVEKIPCDHGQ